MSDWNSELYLKFKKERTQPAIDLANRIHFKNPEKIIDIGCGPGNSTGILKEKFKEARILGVDNSVNMIETAKKNNPDMDFKLFDASRDFDLIIEKFDIVFSNACIQWIPNHKKLLKNMMNILVPGGIMAVQIPIQFDQPMHRIVDRVAKTPKWKEYIKFEKVFNILHEEEYFDVLSEISSDFSMWKTVYMHRMPSHESIIEWYRSTGLKPYLDVLPSEKKEEFEKDVLEEVIKAYPIQKNSEVIFPFPRLFFTAIK